MTRCIFIVLLYQRTVDCQGSPKIIPLLSSSRMQTMATVLKLTILAILYPWRPGCQEDCMKKLPRTIPFAPREMHDTLRQAIIAVLEEGSRTAKEISGEVRISEKEVYGHLEHIQRTMNKCGRSFVVTPAVCRKCGFVFVKRERLKKPGKCPICKGESIEPSFFSINEA